jgi:RimJ/RimL family protein N-acetyltransferase
MSWPTATARLTFRTWRADDLPLALAVWGDPRMTRLVGGPFDEDAVRRRLDAEIALERDHGIQYWPAFLESGAHVGCAGMKLYDLTRSIFEIGFYIRREHWGRGFATEAARAVIAHGFEVLGATELYAGHHPDNRDSKRVLEKLGFQYLRHELYAPTGLQHSLYALTAALAEP